MVSVAAVEKRLEFQAALPDDWPWSSFRHYARREERLVEIESEWTARDREMQATGSGERIFLIPEPALSEVEGL